MKATKRTLVALSLVLMTAGASRATENKEDISGTIKASCLVQVTSDPAIFPLNWETIEALMYSSGVGGNAAREILQISPDQVSDIVLIEILESRAGVSPPPATSSRSRTTQSGLDEDASMDEYMMEEYGMGPGMEGSRLTQSPRAIGGRTASTGTRSGSRSSSYTRPSSTARRAGETAAQYEARRRAEAAARARAAAARTRATQRTPATGTISAIGQTTLLRLTVELPDESAPAAKQFVSALVENLRHVLLDAYDAYARELQSQFTFAERQRDAAEARLADATSQVEAVKVTPSTGLDPADAAVREQLETIVDLSNLSQGMSFEEVVTELENSVEPPLQIQPNWKDLLEFADLEPTTPALMDPLTGIKLSRALELLLDGLSSSLEELTYDVDEGVIAIATEDALPEKMVTRVYEIPALAHSAAGAGSLVRAIQESIEPESWFDLSDTGEGTINVYMGKKLAIRQTFGIHLKIEKFLQSSATDIPASTHSQVPPEMLFSEKRYLLREKQIIEMETVRLQARQSAIAIQISQMTGQIEAKVRPDPVIDELEQLVEMHAAQLSLLERQYELGRLEGSELADVKEKLTRAKIDLARRRQQVSRPAGSVQVGKYNNDLADITIELAEKAAALRVLNEQLGQTEHQLTAATMIDPQVSRIRMAIRAFEMADERINEVNARIVNLRSPVVSVLGGE